MFVTSFDPPPPHQPKISSVVVSLFGGKNHVDLLVRVARFTLSYFKVRFNQVGNKIQQRWVGVGEFTPFLITLPWYVGVF